MKLSRYAPLEHPLVHQFQRAIESFTAAFSPESARQYRGTARHFLIYLGEDHPAVRSLDQLHRDPHILGWFAHLRSHTPPLAQAVYLRHLLFLRSILEELARTAQLPDLAHLIRRDDLPRTSQRLPRPLTAEQDRLLQQELLCRNDLPANVFLLLRHTGMRIGECIDLSYDCLHHVGPDRWAIHVPLGKLKTERMVPVDSFVCELVQRLRFFRSFDPPLLTAGCWHVTKPNRLCSNNCAHICPMPRPQSAFPGGSFRINLDTRMPLRWCALASAFRL
jgi:integrase